MRNSVLPVMTVLVVVAGAAGLQLGETTIAAIDPLHFQGAATPARDVSRGPLEPRRNDFAAASGWEQGYAGRTADCGANCPQSYADQALGIDAGAPLIPYSDPTIEPRWEQASAAADDDPRLIERSAESGRVQRYLHYPVSADQAEMRAALDGEAAVEPDGL